MPDVKLHSLKDAGRSQGKGEAARNSVNGGSNFCLKRKRERERDVFKHAGE